MGRSHSTARPKEITTSKTQKPQRLRVFQRASIPGRVYIHDEERLFIAPLMNISAGGVFINGVTSIPMGHGVKLVVKSPKLEHPIQALGTVVRIEKKERQGLAVEFTSITSHAREIIQNCVFETKIESSLNEAPE